MRKIQFSLIILIMVSLAMCGGIDQITITESAESTIEGASFVETFVDDMGFGSFLKMDISENQTLQNQGVKKEEIDSVTVSSLKLSITSPTSGQDFTFLESLEFYVSAEGLDKKRIAHGGPFESDATNISLGIDSVELAPYVTAPSMDITTEATGRRPDNDTTIKSTITLDVDVNVSGVLCGN